MAILTEVLEGLAVREQAAPQVIRAVRGEWEVVETLRTLPDEALPRRHQKDPMPFIRAHPELLEAQQHASQVSCTLSGNRYHEVRISDAHGPRETWHDGERYWVRDWQRSPGRAHEVHNEHPVPSQILHFLGLPVAAYMGAGTRLSEQIASGTPRLIGEDLTPEGGCVIVEHVPPASPMEMISRTWVCPDLGYAVTQRVDQGHSPLPKRQRYGVRYRHVWSDFVPDASGFWLPQAYYRPTEIEAKDRSWYVGPSTTARLLSLEVNPGSAELEFQLPEELLPPDQLHHQIA